MKVWSCLSEIQGKRFFKISGLDCELYGENKYKKKEHNKRSLVFKVLRQLSYYLNFAGPLIIPMIFIFVSCREKAHDNKEFSRENSKPRRESRLKTR